MGRRRRDFVGGTRRPVGGGGENVQREEEEEREIGQGGEVGGKALRPKKERKHFSPRWLLPTFWPAFNSTWAPDMEHWKISRPLGIYWGQTGHSDHGAVNCQHNTFLIDRQELFGQERRQKSRGEFHRFASTSAGSVVERNVA